MSRLSNHHRTLLFSVSPPTSLPTFKVSRIQCETS
jgi:hypothetical protein